MNVFTEDVLLLNKNRKMVVVGNSKIYKNYGSIIDSYDIVIRFNNFVTNGFENLIGKKTTFRCVCGWNDIENRNQCLEISPFSNTCRESGYVEEYNKNNVFPVILSKFDIHSLTEIPNPSTGLALLLLINYLNISVDIIGFDSFKTPNLWQLHTPTSHSSHEWDIILKLKYISALDSNR